MNAFQTLTVYERPEKDGEIRIINYLNVEILSVNFTQAEKSLSHTHTQNVIILFP